MVNYHYHGENRVITSIGPAKIDTGLLVLPHPGVNTSKPPATF